MNCMLANANISKPLVRAAWVSVSPEMSMIRCGTTGMMMPKPTESSSTVTKIKAKANCGRTVYSHQG